MRFVRDLAGQPFLPHQQHLWIASLRMDSGAGRLSVSMADLRPDDIASYVAQRHASGASNGTVNRELEILSRAFTLGRKLGLLNVTTWRVRDHRLGESAPRQVFFERPQYEAV